MKAKYLFIIAVAFAILAFIFDDKRDYYAIISAIFIASHLACNVIIKNIND